MLGCFAPLDGSYSGNLQLEVVQRCQVDYDHYPEHNLNCKVAPQILPLVVTHNSNSGINEVEHIHQKGHAQDEQGQLAEA